MLVLVPVLVLVNQHSLHEGCHISSSGQLCDQALVIHGGSRLGGLGTLVFTLFVQLHLHIYMWAGNTLCIHYNTL